MFSRDILYSPESFDLHNNLGTELFRAGRVHEACEHFRKSIELSPTWWTSWSNWGVCLERKNNFEGAIRSYYQAINNGRYHLAYVNLARLLLNLGRREEALIFFKR